LFLVKYNKEKIMLKLQYSENFSLDKK